MAMFEIENSKKMDLKNCETTSSKMVEAKTVDDFKAVNCKQHEQRVSQPLPEKTFKKIKTLLIDKFLNILVGLVVIAIATWLTLK